MMLLSMLFWAFFASFVIHIIYPLGSWRIADYNFYPVFIRA